jgi:coenzyme Q-binding protein COQ10
MFDLVADVERYPLFVPLCDRLVIRSRTREGDREILVATMTVAYRFLHESFTSRVTLDRKALTIRAQYLDGPFRHLDNLWEFEPVSARETIVRFSIDYEFRSRTLSALMGSVFDRAFRRFAEAFEARADEVYGTPSAG